MEQSIHFSSGPLELEAMIDRRDGARGVVVTHPHPVYGGSMDNHVVKAICLAYARSGYTTLRFNFRGAGRSQGQYDEGRGEQDDVRAAVALLKDRGMVQIDLAGYSFGAWVNALAVTGGLAAMRLIMVSPPVAFLDFSAVTSLPNLQLVVTGSRDDFGPAEKVQRIMPQWNPAAPLEIIEGCDHFFSGPTRQLEQILSRYIADR